MECQLEVAMLIAAKTGGEEYLRTSLLREDEW